MKSKIKKIISISAIILLSSGCSTTSLLENKKTSHPYNSCKMLIENDDWLEYSIDSYKKWKIPISVQLAIIKHESSFRHDARPIKEKGFFYNTYHSSALGYSQALDGTWEDYKKATGNTKASRKSFKDSVDFVGWYLNSVSKQTGIKRNDTYNLYLAYHEGIGGYKQKTYKRKGWLINVAKNVSKTSSKYSNQLKQCNL